MYTRRKFLQTLTAGAASAIAVNSLFVLDPSGGRNSNAGKSDIHIDHIIDRYDWSCFK